MYNKPIISIGLPVFNDEKYIGYAIESIINQSFTNFELIISDNNSNDRTEEICRTFELKDKRIKYFRQNCNIGQRNNFEFVLNKSMSEYFMWASSDDYLENDCLEELFLTICNNVNSVLAFPNVKLVDESNIFLGKLNLKPNDQKEKSKLSFIRSLALGSKRCSYVFYGLWKTKILKSYLPLPKCRYYDGVFANYVGLHENFCYSGKYNWCRRVYEQLNFERYESKDKILFKYYTSNLQSLKAIFELLKMIVCRNFRIKYIDRYLTVLFFYSYYILIGIFSSSSSLRRISIFLNFKKTGLSTEKSVNIV